MAALCYRKRIGIARGQNLYEGNLDLLNIVMIGIANELPKYNEKYELHHLLGGHCYKKTFQRMKN